MVFRTPNSWVPEALSAPERETNLRREGKKKVMSWELQTSREHPLQKRSVKTTGKKPHGSRFFALCSRSDCHRIDGTLIGSGPSPNSSWLVSRGRD